MKVDRLYAITVYLLNHGKTSATELAKHFEVSVRTIQRDIDSLCCAGIPVIAVAGVKGGYEISDQFKLKNQLISKNDYSYILTALKGLSTATNNSRIADLYEKVITLTDADSMGMLLDFSVLREGNEKLLQRLQSAIENKQTVKFNYTNANNESKIHAVEPIAVIYRWYAWYLLAYSTLNHDYRTYKILRIDNFEITGQNFTRAHGSAETILAGHDKKNVVEHTTVTVKCNPNVVAKTAEYLNGKVIRYLNNQTAIMELTVVESEQLWIGTLLSLGDTVEILSPNHIRQRLVDCAEKIISLYQKL